MVSGSTDHILSWSLTDAVSNLDVAMKWHFVDDLAVEIAVDAAHHDHDGDGGARADADYDDDHDVDGTEHETQCVDDDGAALNEIVPNNSSQYGAM